MRRTREQANLLGLCLALSSFPAVSLLSSRRGAPASRVFTDRGNRLLSWPERFLSHPSGPVRTLRDSRASLVATH
jgi:hypothetical protein